MKKIIITLSLFATLLPSIGHASHYNSEKSFNLEQSVVFRSNQRLRSNDGRQIYLYTNRICELFDEGRLVAKCTYRVQNGEIRLLDERGETVYKGPYVLNRNGNLQSISLAGTTYRAF